VTSGFRRLDERVLHRGPVITLATATFVDPDGQTFERQVVRHPGAVAVVPLVDDDTVLLVRQYRSSVDELLLEIPAGKLDVEGEAPEAAAARELEEEVGRRAGRLERLVSFYNSPGFCDEVGLVFLGCDLEESAVSAQGVEERHMTIEPVLLDEVPAMIADGRLKDAKTIIGLLLTRQRLAGDRTLKR
jgi:ADP-ribose pyrophosphatase